ncbi:MAG: hypothetical protein LBC90_01455, partial [Candidatus Adiutrix sp.]|nr:hypothetical protein [Candidatus Adiutrix sp.]
MMMKPSFMNLKGRLAGLAFPALFIVFAPLSAAWAEHKVIDGTVTGSEFIGNSVVTDSAAGHSVTVVSGGGFDGDAVIGGFAEVSNGTGSATATGNSVTISGGEVKVTEAVIGGGADVFFNSGVGTGSATATDNSVTISGGEVTGYVIGGEADTNDGGGSATVIGNSVTISGGK